jgi:ArsR family transcriptional regulator
MKDIEKVFKAVSDRNRLRILKLLETRKMCVCELAFVLGIKQPSVSRHLRKLKAAGLVDNEQDGIWTNYIISRDGNPFSKEILSQLRKWLNDDAVIKKDQEKADQADRTQLCQGR